MEKQQPMQQPGIQQPVHMQSGQPMQMQQPGVPQYPGQTAAPGAYVVQPGGPIYLNPVGCNHEFVPTGAWSVKDCLLCWFCCP